jgi:hypothetical protein
MGLSSCIAIAVPDRFAEIQPKSELEQRRQITFLRRDHKKLTRLGRFLVAKWMNSERICVSSS